MPHSGGIVRAYRDRRVVKRRQQIGPDVIDFCGGLPQGVYDVLDMFAVKLTETLEPTFLSDQIHAVAPEKYAQELE